MFLTCEMRTAARSTCWGRGADDTAPHPYRPRGQWFSSADPKPGTHAAGNLPETQEPRAHPDPESRKLRGWAQQSVLRAFWEHPMQAQVRGEEESHGVRVPARPAPSPRGALRQPQGSWEAQSRSRSCSKDGEWSPALESLASSRPLCFWSGAGLDQALGTLDRPQRLGEASSLLPPTKATVGHPRPSSPESGEPSKRTTPDQACLNAGKASRLSEACSPAKRRRWPDLPSEAGRLG